MRSDAQRQRTIETRRPGVGADNGASLMERKARRALASVDLRPSSVRLVRPQSRGSAIAVARRNVKAATNLRCKEQPG